MRQSPAHALYSPIQMICSEKYSCKLQVCVLLLKGHILQPLCGQHSQTEAKILDNAISTVYAWSVSPLGIQIVQNVTLAFYAMDITV